jgi:microsomal dipeptidase-like Zn-dependent dipeptidase
MPLLTASLLVSLSWAQDPQEPPSEVLVSIDWQAHPAMHIPWPIFRRGLRDRTPELSYRHQFRQTVHEPYLAVSGVRIFLAAAMASERARNPRQARRLILRQLDYVEAFVARNPDRYAIGSSPNQVRDLLSDTDKIVIIHAIEGGHHLLSAPDAAEFWAQNGVALVTLIHLQDDEFGGAGILPQALGPVLNRKGAMRQRQGERRGLTATGAEAIVALDQAGILVDFSHMSHDTVDDALAFTRAHGIAPVVTHGKLSSIRDDDLAFSEEQVLEIYRQGGVFSLGLSTPLLDPINPTRAVPQDICPSTIEMFGFHHQALQSLLRDHQQELVGASGPLTAEQRTRLAVGWSSDWNGWVSHSEPAYGPDRCRDLDDLDDPLPIDTVGLAHPGLLPDHWERLNRSGLDLEPMLRSAERFLQLWEQARGPAEPAPDDP